MQSEGTENRSRFDLLICLGLATALTYLFWSPLWHGGGLIGGDTYTYFFPQKQYLSERLQAGEFPLWNNRTGHGYPLVAESQTAACYPPNLIAYRLLDVNTAYNAIQISHYVFAFAGVWLFARKLGFSFFARALAAIIFTYGWFPARISLEWAIVTGAWLPWLLLLTDRFAKERRLRDILAIPIGLAFQLLAGHYNLCFITILSILSYGTVQLAITPNLECNEKRKFHSLVGLGIVAGSVILVVATFKLAATFELKQVSQRASSDMPSVDTAYGYIPVVYLTQTIAPWYWYGQGVDLNQMAGAGHSPTNLVEAHLYFGLVPLVIIIAAAFKTGLQRDKTCLTWAFLGAIALLFATGIHKPLMDVTPGFNFFRGAGRYGIVTTFGVAVVAGLAFDRIASTRLGLRFTVGVVVLVTTIADLYSVSQLVGDATITKTPILNYASESPVADKLSTYEGIPRLFCRGANLPNLLGVSSTPPYLGLGPQVYFEGSTQLESDILTNPPTEDVLNWLRRAGVTHILSFDSLDEDAWQVEPVWSGIDPFLNRAWARLSPPAPFYLYSLSQTRGRISWWDEEQIGVPNGNLQVTAYQANSVKAECNAIQPGRIVLTDLIYPGWEVYIDGRLAESVSVEGMYRGVDVSAGEHVIEWRFTPSWSVWDSTWSILGALAAIAVGRWFVLRRSPQ